MYLLVSMQDVRLTKTQIQGLCEAFKTSFLEEDKLWVFGSRADLKKKGGDIDLYVETHLDITQALPVKMMFLRKLFFVFDDRKIDLVVRCEGSNDQDIYTQATQSGVRIV